MVAGVRVCIVSDIFPPAYSGAGQQAFAVGKCLAGLGAEVMVLTSRYEEEAKETRLEGLKVFKVARFAGSPWGLLRYALALARALCRHRRAYDIVHFFSAGRSVHLPLRVAKALGKRVVLTTSMLGDDDLVSISKGRLGKFYLRNLARADAYAGNSPLVTEVSRPLAAVGAIKLVNMPYGVDTARFSAVDSQEAQRALRRELGIPETARVCAFVGAISRRKGVDLLLAAWPQVLAGIPDAFLLLIGPTSWIAIRPEEDLFCAQVKEAAQSAALGKSMCLLETKDVAPYLRAADLFVFPSRQEGLPNAVLEALATGLPLVLLQSNWVAVDFAQPHCNSLVVAEDSAALARALVYVLEDAKRLAAMGAASRELALRSFSLDQKARDYWSLYTSLQMR